MARRQAESDGVEVLRSDLMIFRWMITSLPPYEVVNGKGIAQARDVSNRDRPKWRLADLVTHELRDAYSTVAGDCWSKYRNCTVDYDRNSPQEMKLTVVNSGCGVCLGHIDCGEICIPGGTVAQSINVHI